MNELIVIEPTDTLPVVPDNWDYDISVEKTKTFFYKWKNLTDDIKEELWIAREKLSVDPHISGGMRGRNKSSRVGITIVKRLDHRDKLLIGGWKKLIHPRR